MPAARLTALLCKRCGSREAFACTAKDLAEKTGDTSVLTISCGLIANVASLCELPRLVVAAAKAVLEYLGWRERNKRIVVVCQSCGYWEAL
jgi:hypothetical protein